MGVKCEWKEDSESMSIAMDVIDKYSEIFEGINLDKIRFIRVLDKKKGKDIKVTSVGFPLNIDNPYLYYFEIDDGKWQKMDEAKRNLTIFSGLFEIAPGGMDPESVNYGKKRPMDVKDYAEVIAVAGGRYDWRNEGSVGIHDILDQQDKDKINEILKEKEESI